MFLVVHITIACLSVVYSTYLLAVPSQKGLLASYALVTLTLVTGTYLVFQNGHIVSTCVTGLVYIAFVASELTFVRFRLAKSRS